MPNVRTLRLLRHAKSSWDEPLPDHERPLAERGVRDARAAGRLLQATGWPELVLCSTAMRTRQTWAYASEDHRAPSDVVFTERIYGAGADELRDLISEVDARVNHLMIIGHGPGLPELAEELVGPLPERFKTCGLATFDTARPWTKITEARLVYFALPRG